MKPDFYTKVVLTVIAIMLSVIAAKQLVNPSTTASAQSGAFDSIQYSGPNDNCFFNTRTGDLYFLSEPYLEGTKLVPPAWHYFGKITKVGGPVVGWEARFTKQAEPAHK